MRFGPYFALLNKEFERKNGKIILKAHYDSGGVLTGPEGMIENPDGTPIRKDQTWTEVQALQIASDKYEHWAQDIWKMIDPKIRPQLKQHQFDALGFFAWNIGRAQFGRSTTLRELNAGRFEQAAAGMLLYYRDRLKGGKTGPDGGPARDPNNEVMPKGMSWFKAFRGLLRRQIWTALLFMGLNWHNPAVAHNKIVLSKQPVWRDEKNEWYDEIIYMTKWKDVLAEVRDDPLPTIQGEPDPELFELEPTAMEKAEWESAKVVGADETLQEFVAHRRGLIMPVGKKPLSVNTKQPEEVPYGIDPKAGLQPKEEAERFKRAVKKEKGIEMKQLGQGLTLATGVVAGANELSGEAKTFFDTLGTVGLVLLTVAFSVGIGYWFIGWVREKWNERKEVEAEINAVQGMY